MAEKFKGQFPQSVLKEKHEATMSKREALTNQQQTNRERAINAAIAASHVYAKNPTTKNYRAMKTAARRAFDA